MDGVNFELLLVCLMAGASAIWALDKWKLKAMRGAEPEPWWVEYPKSFLPVILIVLILRSFLFEPFKIPSGSMIPTLLVGDFILVNKYAYGVRLPVVRAKILDVGQPKRGDVMVFKFPENPSQDYIKRVIGVPGDTIVYENKRLKINGQQINTTAAGEYLRNDRMIYKTRYVEDLGTLSHDIIVDMTDEGPAPYRTQSHTFPLKENCGYSTTGLTCVVPTGHYFMMGDNRDESSDSR